MRTARPQYLIKPSAGPGKLLSCSLVLILTLYAELLQLSAGQKLRNAALYISI
jgi:hypothetical protein